MNASVNISQQIIIQIIEISSTSSISRLDKFFAHSNIMQAPITLTALYGLILRYINKLTRIN